MTADEKFSLASAQHAADEGRLAEWVVDFLASPGSSNSALAAAFAMSGATYVGPIRFALDRLTPMAGPVGDEVIVPVAEEGLGVRRRGNGAQHRARVAPPAAVGVASRRQVLP